jgi:hypothetical protein
VNRSAQELTTGRDEIMNLPGAAVSTWVSPFAGSGCHSQTAARDYPSRVAMIRTVSKFMTNEPP